MMKLISMVQYHRHSTLDQYKALIEEARNFIDDNDFTVNDKAYFSSKKSEDIVEENYRREHYF